MQALVIKDGSDFQHILRILGTNVDGKQKVMYAMTAIKGVGRRFSNIVCKKADVDMDKRAGELTQKEMDDLVNVIQNPLEYKIPQWMLNRRKDFKDGKTSQISSNREFPTHFQLSISAHSHDAMNMQDPGLQGILLTRHAFRNEGFLYSTFMSYTHICPTGKYGS